MANEVEAAHHCQLKPVLIGGDCAILPGALLGCRRILGNLALVHIDGHSDFRHPGNWQRNPGTRPGAAAGMDLALVTGRGEPLLTEWPGIAGALVEDKAVIQLGERESLREDYEWPDIADTEIRRITVFDALTLTDSQIVGEIYQRLNQFPEMPYWIHLDLDVVDSAEMPAVDCPGQPGLTAQRVVNVCRELFSHSRCCGITVTIYDPDLDNDRAIARRVADMIKNITHDT